MGDTLNVKTPVTAVTELLNAPPAAESTAADDSSSAAEYFTTASRSGTDAPEDTTPAAAETAEDAPAADTTLPAVTLSQAESDAQPVEGEVTDITISEENAEETTEASDTTEVTTGAEESETEIVPETEADTEEETVETAETATAEPVPAPVGSDNNSLLITIIIVMGVLILGLIVLLIVKSVTGRRPKYTPMPIQMPPQMPQGQPSVQMQAGAVPATAPIEHPTPSPYKVGKLHEQGARGEQQDSFGISNEELIPEYGLLAVVADGMGGLEDGGRVSAAATRSVLNAFLMTQGRLPSKELLVTLLKQAENDVNDTLGEDNYRKSGTTLVMGYFRGNEFNFLSIGDSRISLFRNNVLMQLNREHTYEIKQLIRSVNGEMSISDALSDPKGSGLVNFLGKGEISAIDMPVSPIKLMPGDKIILMSDGVYNALSDEELSEALSAPTEQAALNVRAAVAGKNFSNQDNYTAVVIGYGA